MNIAVVITVFNRKEKTIACLRSLEETHRRAGSTIKYAVYLTDDGSTDGTREALSEQGFAFDLHILPGTGSLYWNGGMINSWQAAVDCGGYDGYLWLNNDTTVLEPFWSNLAEADAFARQTYGRGGIYVGSTRDAHTGEFSYGGFNFTNRLTLKDQFVMPDGQHFRECQCAHGNITFVSADVVEKMGIFYDGYIHGAGDHDYTYRAWRSHFPILVMKDYAGECENDHTFKDGNSFRGMNLRQRIAHMKSPFGYNFHNTLLFQKRNFPYRYPFVWVAGYMKCLFPGLMFRLYHLLRS